MNNFTDIISTFFDNLQVYDTGNLLLRYGAKGDGGYVAPTKCIYKSDVFYTYGVGGEVSFENDISTFIDKPFYFFDHTINSFPSPLKPNYNFIKEGIGTFHACNQYETHLKRYNHEDKKIFLKVDVEGAEYGTIDVIPLNLQKNITCLILEIHNFHDIGGVMKFNKIASNLKDNFILCHLHYNNLGVPITINNHAMFNAIELTYINKTESNLCELPEWSYPIFNLDIPNNNQIKDISVSFMKRK